MEKLIVKIFVNGVSKKELKLLIEKMKFENTDSFEIDIIKNSDFNESKSKEFPDGFLYFPLLIECYSNEINKESHIYNTNIILKELWRKNISAIASCDYEDKLVEKGGYKSKNTPWLD